MLYSWCIPSSWHTENKKDKSWHVSCIKAGMYIPVENIFRHGNTPLFYHERTMSTWAHKRECIPHHQKRWKKKEHQRVLCAATMDSSLAGLLRKQGKRPEKICLCHAKAWECNSRARHLGLLEACATRWSNTQLNIVTVRRLITPSVLDPCYSANLWPILSPSVQQKNLKWCSISEGQSYILWMAYFALQTCNLINYSQYNFEVIKLVLTNLKIFKHQVY